MSSSALPEPPQGGAVRLDDWGVIVASGADAASFLQSQLTQDVQALGPREARLAGWCSAKGRLLASFVIWRLDDEAFALACSTDLLAPTLKRLSMFVLRARCRLADASHEISLHGLAGPAASAALAQAGVDVDAAPWSCSSLAEARLVKLPPAVLTEGEAGLPRWLWAQPATLPAPALPGLPAMDASLWAWLEVQSGVARIVAATADRFVPQMVNFEQTGGVDFHKGCYPGQEVVARSQYRGTLKRRAWRFDVDAAAQPGADLYAATDPAQPAGTLVLAAAHPAQSGTSSVLAEIKLAVLDQDLRLGAADGPLLRPRGLPYPLDFEP